MLRVAAFSSVNPWCSYSPILRPEMSEIDRVDPFLAQSHIKIHVVGEHATVVFPRRRTNCSVGQSEVLK